MLHIHTVKNILRIAEEQDMHTLGDGSFGDASDEILNQQVEGPADLILCFLTPALAGTEIASRAGNLPTLGCFLTSTAILTVSFVVLLDWFRLTMQNKGSWTNYECFHHWLWIGLGILQNLFMPGLGLFLVNLVETASFMARLFAQCAAIWAPIHALAQAALLAWFYLLAIAIFYFTRAFYYLTQSF